MSFTEQDILALRLLLREEFEEQISPFRVEVRERFDQIVEHLDGLYQRDEKREQEYLFMREQLRHLEHQDT